MTDLRDPNQSNVRTGSRPATGTPRWVKGRSFPWAPRGDGSATIGFW